MALNDPKHKAARKAAVEKSLGMFEQSQAKEIFGGGRVMTPSEMGHTPIPPEAPAEAPTEAPTGTRVNLSRGLSSGPLYDYSDFEIPEAMKMTFRAEDSDTGDYDTGDYDTGDYDTGDYDTGEPDTGIDPMEYMAEKYKRLGEQLKFFDPSDLDEDKALGPSTMPQATANDYSEYQQEYVYGREGDAGEAAYGDLDNRLNNPEDTGTISSSSHPDWRGTGYTMYEIVGEDMTRYFLESPDDATALNITGHPDAGRE